MTAGPVAPPLALGCVLAAVAYAVGAARLRRRGDAWPWRRDSVFAAGWPWCGGWPVRCPAGRSPCTPAVICWWRWPTRAARGGPSAHARAAAAAAGRSAPRAAAGGALPAAGWLLFPPVAAAVDLGGLWLLHRTNLWAAAHHDPLLGGLLELHMLLAGLLFAMAVCRLDPVRGRCGLPLRAVTLLAGCGARGPGQEPVRDGAAGDLVRRGRSAGRGAAHVLRRGRRGGVPRAGPGRSVVRDDRAAPRSRRCGTPFPWVRADPAVSQAYDDQRDVVAAAVGHAQAGEQGVGEGSGSRSAWWVTASVRRSRPASMSSPRRSIRPSV